MLNFGNYRLRWLEVNFGDPVEAGKMCPDVEHQHINMAFVVDGMPVPPIMVATYENAEGEWAIDENETASMNARAHMTWMQTNLEKLGVEAVIQQQPMPPGFFPTPEPDAGPHPAGGMYL